MKVILNNGTELTPIIVTGEKRRVQNEARDTLTFVFGDESTDYMETIFTEKNCETIKIVGDDESEAIYKDYVIPEIMKKPVEVKTATIDCEAVYEKRVFVSMSQLTYKEKKLADMEAQNMDTALAVAELGVLLAGGME